MSTRMSPADAVWYLGEEPRNPMVVSAILWFDRGLDVDRLRSLLTERLLDRHPVFLQRIVPDRSPRLPRWEPDPDFDLDRHIAVTTMDPPGDHRQLEIACSLQRSDPLPRDRPLWQVDVLQGYRGSGSAIHVRVHHSIGDGLALMALLLVLADEIDPSTVPVTEDDVHPPLAIELLHRSEHAVAEASRLALHPVELVARARRAAEALVWGARLLTPIVAPRSSLIGFPEGSKRMVWDPDGLPLDAIKAAGKHAGATVNDVLLTLMTGALHRYLAARAELADEVLVVVPISLRAPGEPLPRHLGNRIGLLPVLLPVGLTDPEERLAVIQDRVGALKSSVAPAVSRSILAATSLLTPDLERALHKLNQVRSTGVVTNVAGPRVPLHVAGARIDGVIGWGGMTGNLNLNAAFVSLSGRVFVGLVTDAAITPDPERILEHLHEEWHALTDRVAV